MKNQYMQQQTYRNIHPSFQKMTQILQLLFPNSHPYLSTNQLLIKIHQQWYSFQLKASWINVLDSGGQPQFAHVSRAFIRGNTMNIICTKLTENLSDKPKFCYSLNGKLLSQPSELQTTNLQLIEHFVHSIVASKNAFKEKETNACHFL